jgi:hypothetical protein
LNFLCHGTSSCLRTLEHRSSVREILSKMGHLGTKTKKKLAVWV